MAETDDPRRALPAIETILGDPQLVALRRFIAPEFLTLIAREVVADERKAIEQGRAPAGGEGIARRCAEQVQELLRPSLRRVINATGVILHTGLGRAPLSPEATAALKEAAGYAAVEFGLGSGDRGDRQAHVEPLLCLLTGAESALVVNNNAAALYLTLNALAFHREVIVSRGQLIEIGGSFRLPDIMARSGAKLVEVGTTNRTRIDDFRAAITAKTSLLLRAHTSNYRIEGFTESVSVADLVELGREHGILVVDDLGSGVMWDWTKHGLPAEPSVRESVAAGADLVLISGDKALGGPQAGILLGRRELIAKLKKSPLARVLRPDKLTLAALSATLRSYLLPGAVSGQIPVWRMMTASVGSLRSRAESLKARLVQLAEWMTLEVRESQAEAGSGTMPAVSLPSIALCCLPAKISASKWAKRLRLADVPVVATVGQDLVWLDMRTIFESDEDDLLAGIVSSLKKI